MPNQLKTQLKRIRNKKKLLIALIFALLAVFVWIFVSIFSTQGASGITPEMKKLAQPLKPTLNHDLLEKIEQKRYLSPQDLEDFPVFALLENEGGGYLVVDVVNDRLIERRGPNSMQLEAETLIDEEDEIGQEATTSAAVDQEPESELPGEQANTQETEDLENEDEAATADQNQATGEE